MAHIGKLPPVHRYITGHDETGTSILLNTVPEKVEFKELPDGIAAFGLPYTTSSLPANLSAETDIAAYQQSLIKPPGLIISNGTVVRYVDMPPGVTSPMHRTVSLDYGVVLEGEVELILEKVDGGEKKVLKRGDLCVQRATLHAWRNVSQTEWARMLYILQPCTGLDVTEDLDTIQGVPASS